MVEIVIYTKPWCGYCSRAKRLLRSKGVEFEEIDVSLDRAREEEMIRRARRSTVPQIFIDGRHVGGSDDLAALEALGELDPLLQTDAPQRDDAR
jgi:glutaredoxin 3